MYDLKMLEEIKSQEERIHFSSFDYNDAYTLGTMLRERGLTTPKPIAIRIVFDDIILYQSFLPGTDESNNQWMNRKQHTVERCHTSSLRAAVERELNGVKENWQQDESHYAFCGGGFPIIVNDEFRGVAMISGLPHLEDHRNLVEVMDQFCAQTNAYDLFLLLVLTANIKQVADISIKCDICDLLFYYTHFSAIFIYYLSIPIFSTHPADSLR